MADIDWVFKISIKVIKKMSLLFIFLLPILFISRNVYLFILSVYGISGKLELICLYLGIFSFLFLIFYGIARALLPLVCTFFTSKRYSDKSKSKAINSITYIVLNKMNVDIAKDNDNAFNILQELCFIPVTFLLYIFWINTILVYLFIIPLGYYWFNISCVINRYYQNKDIKQFL